MSARQTYVLARSVLASDRAVVEALKDLPEYAPPDLSCSTESLIALDAALAQAQRDMQRARLAYDAARTVVLQAGWALHDKVLLARAAVFSQFGPESHAVHAIGLKRRSERKRVVRRKTDPVERSETNPSA